MAEPGPARAGTVYLAGWGPGEVQLTTQRTRALVAGADLVILPGDIETTVRACMQGDAVSLAATASGLQARVVAAAGSGQVVVWLTRGDPVVDGPGAEILQDLHGQGINAEIVPGLPLAVATAPMVQASLRRRPLHGRRVLVTRPPHQAAEMVAWLREAGAESVLCPTICIEPVTQMEEIDTAMDQLGQHAWVIFTSANGVDCFFNRLQERGLDLRAFAGARVAAIGSATAAHLRRHGLSIDMVPHRYQAEGLLEQLSHEDLNGRKILIPRAETARDILPQTLRQRGAAVQVLVVYRAVPPAGLPENLHQELSSGRIHAVTFTSSSTVSRFKELLLPVSAPQLLHDGGVTVACIGPITSGTARELGFQVTVEASRFTVPDLVAALSRHFTDAS